MGKPLLQKVANKDAKLRVNMLWVRIEQVIVEGSLLDDAASSFLRNPDAEGLIEDVRMKSLARDVRLHSVERPFH